MLWGGVVNFFEYTILFTGNDDRNIHFYEVRSFCINLSTFSVLQWLAE